MLKFCFNSPSVSRTTAAAFWKNAERVPRKISGACVDTKLRGIKATCIISGDSGPRVSPRFQREQKKPLQWPANDINVILCVRAYEHNQRRN